MLPELRMKEYSEYIADWRSKKGFITSVANMPEKLLLVISEISEAEEVYRHIPERELHRERYAITEPKFWEEIADTFIRLMDICGSLGIDPAKIIQAKMAVNEKRPHKHGKNS